MTDHDQNERLRAREGGAVSTSQHEFDALSQTRYGGGELDLSSETYNQALRDVAVEELAVVRARYLEHRDPVRCAVGISLVLRNFARDVFGEERVNKLKRITWLNFLLRTSNAQVLRPDFIETMSAALFGDPVDVELPGDCSFWFETAERWIAHQSGQRPLSTCTASFGRNL
ncbi:MAG: hypothetical protein QF570_11660 [Myxococcota bacterium]|jgi:hypothetical protein|nr:hypothetical protein [Myxococcota bacterium]